MRALTTAVGLGALVVASSALAASPPRLVLLVAVDQLRRDRLDEGLPGGLGRIAREGRVFVDAMLDHAATETCPGHATMLTGRHPGPIGITSNTWIDLETGERRYCVDDPSPDAAVIGGGTLPLDGRSPRALEAESLGDWMKAARPGTRVFAVSAKDRAAITLGGQRPDGVYWLGLGDVTGFTTSRYYADELPAWVRAWNAGLAERVPDTWRHATSPADDQPGESEDHARASPHPLRDDDPEEFALNLYHSPFVDLTTLGFVRRLVEVEGVGKGEGTDLLAVSLSGTDSVGHLYGPGSLESQDALERLDHGLGELLSFLEERTGGRLVVALTSDHGVLPLPERLVARGELTCPLPGGRVGLIRLVLGLYWDLYWELSPWSWPGAWMNVASQLSVDRDLAAEHGVAVEDVVAAAERSLEAHPAIREAWTRREIAEGESDWARLYRNSAGPRSGDLAVQPEPTCLLDFAGAGTTHGTPYAYDREVPLVFWGSGIEAGRTPGPAATIDIAPTLAGRVGLAIPDGLDGRDLLAP